MVFSDRSGHHRLLGVATGWKGRALGFLVVGVGCRYLELDWVYC